MTIAGLTDQEIAERGEAIYREKIRPSLNAADKGKYLTINVQTGEYEIDTDDLTGALRASARFGRNVPLYTLRVGYRAVASFRPGNTELSEW
jgi:hypothetical protein